MHLALLLQEHQVLLVVPLLVHLVRLAHLEHLVVVEHLRLRQLRHHQRQSQSLTRNVFPTQAEGVGMDHLIVNPGLRVQQTIIAHATIGAARISKAFASPSKVNGLIPQCASLLCFHGTHTSR